MVLIAAAIIVIYFSVITVRILSLLLGLLLRKYFTFFKCPFFGGLHCLHPVCGLSCPATCGILVPHPGLEPMVPALEGGFSTTGSSRKSPGMCSLNLR